MSRETIVERNRANALNSTGPRSPEGKAVSSRNAIRHGVVSKPTSAQIAPWLAVILDHPGIGPEDIVGSDDRSFRALALADAEVRVQRAEAALAELEEASLRRAEMPVEMNPTYPRRSWRSTYPSVVSRTEAEQERILDQIAARIDVELATRHQLRLHRRYLAQALGNRRRAFEAWIELEAELKLP